MDKTTQSIEIVCPKCSNHLTENATRSGEGADMRLTCDACGYRFQLKEVTDPAIRELGEKALEKEVNSLRDRLARAFRGSKSVKFKPGR